MRNISFSMTTEAVRRREKTVTRRLGWWGLKRGDVLQAVEKAQGLKRGVHVKPICLIRVVSVTREPLFHIHIHACDGQETVREGFPNLSSCEFEDMFCEANRVPDYAEVNRIEFEYVDG